MSVTGESQRASSRRRLLPHEGRAQHRSDEPTTEHEITARGDPPARISTWPLTASTVFNREALLINTERSPMSVESTSPLPDHPQYQALTECHRIAIEACGY